MTKKNSTFVDIEKKMEIHIVIGLVLALLIGLSLGMIGSGGSILTVPILVYIVGIPPVEATAYSLFIVGSTSLVGSMKHISDKNVNFQVVFFFGIPSMLSVFFARSYLLPLIPNEVVLSNQLIVSKNKLLMILFAIVMLVAATKMVKRNVTTPKTKPIEATDPIPLAIQGMLIGCLSGLVGAGGGFLIIPALVFFANLSMRKAIGTSLTIIAIQSLFGFLGDVLQRDIQWGLLLSFSTISVVGLLIGIAWSKKIIDTKLKKVFGWFVLSMAIYILVKELI